MLSAGCYCSDDALFTLDTVIVLFLGLWQDGSFEEVLTMVSLALVGVIAITAVAFTMLRTRRREQRAASQQRSNARIKSDWNAMLDRQREADEPSAE